MGLAAQRGIVVGMHMTTRFRPWAFVALALVALGCSAADESASEATTPAATASAGPSVAITPTPSAEPLAVPQPTVEATPTATPTPIETGPNGPVTLAFGGDVHFEGQLDGKVRSDPSGMLSAIAPVLSAADVAAVNLETAVTEGGDPAPKQYTFAAPSTAFEALEAAGVDVVTLANNHGMDFGQAGLADTLDAAEAVEMPILGAGRDETEAYAPWITTVNGRDVAFIGATQVLDSFALEAWVAGPDKPGLASAKENGIERLVSAVDDAEAQAHTVVVFLHWGREGDSCPLPRQPELAQTLIDAGADILVGGHAHRLQGAGFLGDAYVSYGLGNFVFYTQSGPGTNTGVLSIRIDADDSLHPEWVPAVLNGGVPVPLDGDAATVALERWNGLRDCAGLTEQPQ